VEPDPLEEAVVPPEEATDPDRGTPFGAQVAEAALRFLDAGAIEVNGERFRMACSELVRASLAAVGCTDGPPGSLGDGGTASLHDYCEEAGILHRDQPAPGDFILFDNTYDRNRNRKLDDPLSHVGVVVAVRDDGTVEFVHVGSGRVRRGHMNLDHPWSRKDRSGNPLNDQLRRKTRNDPRKTRYMAGELFRTFCTPQPCGE